MNLQNSLLNLTLELDLNVSYPKETQQWFEAIDKILSKQHYHHLKKVNLLLEVSNDDEDDTIERFFEILKKLRVVLKYQFDQLNIGLI